MSALEITVGSRLCREFDQTDWEGESIPREKATEYWLEIPLTITGKEPEREFTLVTTVLAKIPKKGLPEDRNLKERVVRHVAGVQLTTEFARRGRWDTFGKEELDLKAIRPQGFAADTVADDPPLIVDALPALYDKLALDAARLKRTNAAYDKAKDCLYELAEGAGYGFNSHTHEVYTLLNFIEACNRCSADSYMYAWYREKTPRVRHAFDDLFRRKNPNHLGYERSASYARSTLWSFHAPYAYRDEPPSPHQAEEFLK